MDDFDDEYSSEIEEYESMTEEELQALEDYENRDYTQEDMEQDAYEVSKEEIDAAISKDKLNGYIDRKGDPSMPEGSPLERYENVDVRTRQARSPTVDYVEDTVQIDGRNVTGRFPEFESMKDVQLPADLRFERIGRQERYCNEALRQDVQQNPDKYREVFSQKQLEQINAGQKPEGFTWHHHQDVGRMQLVDAQTHKSNRHDAGFILWGGGKR